MIFQRAIVGYSLSPTYLYLFQRFQVLPFEERTENHAGTSYPSSLSSDDLEVLSSPLSPMGPPPRPSSAPSSSSTSSSIKRKQEEEEFF